MRSFLQHKKGFTLIEVVISMAILLMIVAPVSSMVLTSVKVNKTSEEKLRAVALAQKYMEQIKTKGKMQLTAFTYTKLISGNDESDSFVIQDVTADGFTIETKVAPDAGSNFESDSTKELPYDMTIELDWNATTAKPIVDIKRGVGATVTVAHILDADPLTFNIENKSGDYINCIFNTSTVTTVSTQIPKNVGITERRIQVLMKTDMMNDAAKESDIIANVRNELSNEEVKIYITKYPNVTKQCIVKNNEGTVKWYPNILTKQDLSNSSRVYTITVTVSKGDMKYQIVGNKTVSE